MKTNPYATPLAYTDPATSATEQVLSVVRVFRMLGWLACVAGAVAIIPIVGLFNDAVARDRVFEAVGTACLYLIPLIFGVLYLRSATRLARGDPTIYRRARWFSAMIIVGFPLFPFGLSCFPVLIAVGIMCLRTLKRHYAPHCEFFNAQEPK